MSRVRLDQRLRALNPDLSWARIRRAIERGQVAVDDVIVREAGHMLDPAAAIDFDPSRPALPYARLNLLRLYEDGEILVVDKPAGLLTIASHPEAREIDDTVLRRVQDYARRLHGRAGYAGVLHRLDRGTSGALALALTRDAHRAGRALFAAHQFERSYLALVRGVPAAAQGTIDAPISNDYVSGRRAVVRDAARGRHAVTHFEVRERFADASLLLLTLETGRQHQIRLHLQALGHPLLGETVYAGPSDPSRPSDPSYPSRPSKIIRPMLHAFRLAFPHPISGDWVRVEAQLPDDFARLLARQRQTMRHPD